MSNTQPRIQNDQGNDAGARDFSRALPPGTHHLDNAALREAFGLTRVTAGARSDISRRLQRQGLHILSDPANEPLVVRKAVRGHDRRAGTSQTPGKRTRTALLAGILLFVLVGLGLIVAAVGGDDAPSTAADRVAEVAADDNVAVPVEPAAEEPVATLADAEALVNEGRYAAAVAAAAALGDDDRSFIRRRISRRIARAARRALRRGDRAAARRHLALADNYPTTDATRVVRLEYRAAKRRAATRRAARRRAAERRASERRAAERAAAARRAAQRAAAEAPAPAPSSAPSSPSGPSTTNWCGKRDGDGDGIYCE